MQKDLSPSRLVIWIEFDEGMFSFGGKGVNNLRAFPNKSANAERFLACKQGVLLPGFVQLDTLKSSHLWIGSLQLIRRTRGKPVEGEKSTFEGRT